MVYLGSKALKNHFLLALMEPLRVVAVETVECVDPVSEVRRVEAMGVLGTRGRASMLAIVIDCLRLVWLIVGWMVGMRLVIKSSG